MTEIEDIRRARSQSHRRLWDGTSDNPQEDARVYLEGEAANLQFLIGLPDDVILPEDKQIMAVQLQNLQALMATDNPLQALSEQMLSQLPRESETGEISDIFSEQVSHLKSYLE